MHQDFFAFDLDKSGKKCIQPGSIVYDVAADFNDIEVFVHLF
jgi:hypothetical protein